MRNPFKKSEDISPETDNTFKDMWELIDKYYGFIFNPDGNKDSRFENPDFLGNTVDDFIGILESKNKKEIKDQNILINDIRCCATRSLVKTTIDSIVNPVSYETEKTVKNINQIMKLHDGELFPQDIFNMYLNEYNFKYEIKNLIRRCFKKNDSSFSIYSNDKLFIDRLEDVVDTLPVGKITLSPNDIMDYLNIDDFEYIRSHFAEDDIDWSILNEAYGSYKECKGKSVYDENNFAALDGYDIKEIFSSLRKAVLIASIKNQINMEDSLARFCSGNMDFHENYDQLRKSYSGHPKVILINMEMIPDFIESANLIFAKEDLIPLYNRYIEILSEGLEYNLNIESLEKAIEINNKYLGDLNHKPLEETLASSVNHYFEHSISQIEKLYASSTEKPEQKEEIKRRISNLLEATGTLSSYIKPNRYNIYGKITNLQESIHDCNESKRIALRDQYRQELKKLRSGYNEIDSGLESLTKNL